MVKKRLFAAWTIISIIISVASSVTVYGPIGAPFGFLAQLILCFAALLGFIPFGFFIFIYVSWFNVLPFLVSVFGIKWDWPVTLAFIMALVLCIGISFKGFERVFTNWHRL